MNYPGLSPRLECAWIVPLYLAPVRQPCVHWRSGARQNGRGPGPSFCNPPPRCRRRNAERTISDVFDSPQRSEDYREMYDTRTEGTPGAFRRPGVAGRPRAASQAGLRATQRDAGGRQPRTIEHAQSMLLSRWRPGVGRQARQRGGIESCISTIFTRRTGTSQSYPSRTVDD